MQIVTDFSLVFLVAWITIHLAVGVLPDWHPDWPWWLHWTLATVAALALIASILLHELAHALVARTQGMKVRRIHLFVFGGVAEIDGRPPSPRAEIMIAMVGPLTSGVLGALCAGLGSALVAEDPVADPTALLLGAGPVATLLIWLGPFNLFLAALNMIPGFPLDGGHVLRALVWWVTRDPRKGTAVAATVGQLFAGLLIGYGAYQMLDAPVQGLWLLLIGAFMILPSGDRSRRGLAPEAEE